MTEETTPAALPRRIYFNALDKFYRSGHHAADLQNHEIGRRHKLAANVTQRAEDVAGAIKALRALDATGNTEAAVRHLQAAVDDLNLAHRNLAENVEAAVAGWRERFGAAGDPGILLAGVETAADPGPVPEPAGLDGSRAAFIRYQEQGGTDA